MSKDNDMEKMKAMFEMLGALKGMKDELSGKGSKKLDGKKTKQALLDFANGLDEDCVQHAVAFVVLDHGSVFHGNGYALERLMNQMAEAYIDRPSDK
jgi:hypothetical protein